MLQPWKLVHVFWNRSATDEGNVLFKDTLSTFYLLFYCIRPRTIRTIQIVIGRKEIFNLMTHSAHFFLQFYCIRPRVKEHSENDRKEKNILFNGTLNTFYLWLYDIGHMVQDHSDK